jgi:hypothetical protein
MRYLLAGKLCSRKTTIFIDEFSMMDLSMLSVINNHCKIAISLNTGSPDLFVGLPIVIPMGNFFQFPFVGGPALWKEPRRGNAEDEDCRFIWHRFKYIVILDEQMRQSEDPSFRDLFRRTRTATLTEADHHLNSKAITSLVAPHLEDTITVLKLNSLRHQVNRTRIEHFAQVRCQKFYVFPALHSRAKLRRVLRTRILIAAPSPSLSLTLWLGCSILFRLLAPRDLIPCLTG